MGRVIVQDYGTVEDARIIQEDDTYLIVKAVIASEIVQQYADGWAYKPADELEKAAWTADGRWVKTLSHPQGPSIINVRDVHGRMEAPVFRKDLHDPKTKRPCRRGIEVDIRFFKKRTEADVLEKIRKGELKDNSIGFSCDKDYTPGTFQGQKYDYVQRDILIDHLAAPIAKGRCPSPYCGINVDSIEADMWEENDNSIRSGHGDKTRFDPDSFRTIDVTEGIKAVVGCPKGKYADGKCSVGMQSQSFIFDKAKFTMEQAKAWFTKHHAQDSAVLAEYFGCPVCRRIDEVGPLEAGRRLMKQYGVDVLEIIEGRELPSKDAATEKEKKVQTQDSDDVLMRNRKALQDIKVFLDVF